MSKTFDLLRKAHQARAAMPAASSLPDKQAEEQMPFIEVGGPEAIEASADVLAYPPPARKPFLQAPAAAAEAPAKPVTQPTLSIWCWNS